MEQLPHFRAALERLGRTDVQIAAKIGMSDRAVAEWRRRNIPRVIRTLVKQPDLLVALLEDARAAAEETPQSS